MAEHYMEKSRELELTEGTWLQLMCCTPSRPLWIYFEESTSSIRATVLLQTVCNALVRGHVNLKEDSGEEVSMSVVDGWSKDGILWFGWSDI